MNNLKEKKVAEKMSEEQAKQKLNACPHHGEIERRLDESQQQFNNVLSELRENNRQLERLNTNMQNQQQDLDSLKKDVWGRNGDAGLVSQVSSLQTAIKTTLIILFGGGGVWLVIAAVIRLAEGD